MPETRQYTVYKFSELSEDAKEKVLERYRDWNVSDEYWYEHFNDFLKEDLKEFGLLFDSFSFSGFFSQGDGASIRYSISDTFKFIRHLMPDKKDSKLINRLEEWAVDGIDHDRETQRRRDFYYYDDYCAVEFNLYGANQPLPRLSDFVERLNKASTEFHKDLCRKLYRDLQREYDYQTSDTTLTEYFIQSDYVFTQEGVVDR